MPAMKNIDNMLKFRKFVPLLNRVLIEKSMPMNKTKAGILLSEKDSMRNSGKVIAVGPGAVVEGEKVPVSVKVGQTVLLPDYGGVTFKLADDKEYVVYKDEDLLGILEEEQL